MEFFIFTTNNKKRSLFAVITLFFLFLLSFTGASLFSGHIPPPSKPHRPPSRILIDETETETPSQSPQYPPSIPPSSQNPDTFLPHLRKSHSFEIESENKEMLKMLPVFGASRAAVRRRGDYFSARVDKHFEKCKIRFFMIWIASINSFQERAFYSIESVFKTHPNGCVLIVSNSLDSIKGRQILKPFVEKGFKVTAVSPDFEFLFKNTMAQTWFTRFVKTRKAHHVRGDIPLGQNLSNLVRLCLLYKYGGVYIDFDVIILKSFFNLKNSIGAQVVDKNWTRLNNAVLVFDKMHPLLYKFIEEFALTFDGIGHKYGAPYLVSRVVSRLQGRPGYNFTVLPTMAFYPVNWDKVRIIFRGGKNETDARWLKVKYDQIRNQSYSLHFWHKQSRVLPIEDGSIFRKILSQHCIFCNTTATISSNATSKNYTTQDDLI